MVTLFCCRDDGADRRSHHPLKVLPVCYRSLAEFETLRQITGGIRSILHNGAQGTRAWPGAWARMAVGLIAAALFGFGG